jgi:hypothetical protein
MNEAKKSIQHLNRKQSNLDEKFSKEIEILKKGKLRSENSIYQMKNSIESITSGLDQVEETVSDTIFKTSGT